MREIKFRAWIQADPYDESDSPKMEMCYDLAFEDYEPVNDLLGAVEHLMQYTGLKDKNGVEIYEGDLVRHSLRATPLPVGFSEGSFVYIDDKAGLSINCDVWEEREVIGNIYENPDLLNSKEASTKGGETK